MEITKTEENKLKRLQKSGQTLRDCRIPLSRPTHACGKPQREKKEREYLKKQWPENVPNLMKDEYKHPRSSTNAK